jgi:hypothetical protein
MKPLKTIPVFCLCCDTLCDGEIIMGVEGGTPDIYATRREAEAEQQDMADTHREQIRRGEREPGDVGFGEYVQAGVYDFTTGVVQLPDRQCQLAPEAKAYTDHELKRNVPAPMLSKPDLIEQIIGPKPAKDVSQWRRNTWQGRARAMDKFTVPELVAKLERQRADEAHEAKVLALARELFPQVQAIADAGGQSWRTALGAHAACERVPFHPPMTITKGEASWVLARHLAERIEKAGREAAPVEVTASAEAGEAEQTTRLAI